jgi:hypothetical protein
MNFRFPISNFEQFQISKFEISKAKLSSQGRPIFVLRHRCLRKNLKSINPNPKQSGNSRRFAARGGGEKNRSQKFEIPARDRSEKPAVVMGGGLDEDLQRIARPRFIGGLPNHLRFQLKNEEKCVGARLFKLRELFFGYICRKGWKKSFSARLNVFLI